jgi:serine/threonine protein kinase
VDTSVEKFCNLLARSGLLPPADVRTLRQRWLQEAGPHGSDGDRFTRWLVARHYITEFQAQRLSQGHTSRFFLDHYKILERIAKGRMAGVFKAVHELGQVVAVKVLPPSRAADPQFLARFQREARLAWQLHHPNVVRTFQAGESAGLHYLVMEYLEGETLEEVLRRRGRLPAGEALRLVYQALQGLQHLHERGLVHRNLEPANLMLVPTQGSVPLATTFDATVKILDISLARAEFDPEGEDGSPLNLTHDGVMLGNAPYLAPEQAVNPHGADIRADIYSLGCILYHCLTAHPPFSDTNALRQVIRHATEKPRPLRDFPLEVPMPEGLQQVLDWMMHKDPAQRYPTPERAAQALRAFLGGDGKEPPATPKSDAPLQAYLKWLAAIPLAEPVNGQGAEKQPQGTRVGASKAPADATRRSLGELFTLDRRDCVLLGLGAIGLLVAEGIGWLLGQLFKPREKPAPPEDAHGAKETRRHQPTVSAKVADSLRGSATFRGDKRPSAPGTGGISCFG